jgi:DNA-binding CsgD family transcriptional regulator
MKATLYPAFMKQVSRLGRRGEVLAGMWAGKGMKEIAADLGISPKTVEFHRAQLYRLFGVGDPVSLCRRAMAVGLINPNSEFRDPKEIRGPKSETRNAKFGGTEGPRHVRD